MIFPTGWPTCRGLVTLSQIARRLVVPPVACNRCDRRGSPTARLMGNHGTDLSDAELRHIVAANCVGIQPCAAMMIAAVGSTTELANPTSNTSSGTAALFATRRIGRTRCRVQTMASCRPRALREPPCAQRQVEHCPWPSALRATIPRFAVRFAHEFHCPRHLHQSRGWRVVTPFRRSVVGTSASPCDV